MSAPSVRRYVPAVQGSISRSALARSQGYYRAHQQLLQNLHRVPEAPWPAYDEICELFTHDPVRFSEWDDDDGVTQRCCIYCDPPLTPEEEAEARAEFGDAEWDSLA